MCFARGVFLAPYQSIVSADPATDGIAVSLVSHGQKALVEKLVHQIAAQRDALVRQVIVTHNLAEEPLEPPEGGWPFRLIEIFNEQPAGFGANHNRAFLRCDCPYFCVLNPDVYLLDGSIWSRLIEAVQQPGVGCAYPVLLESDGSRQDQEREAVTPLALWRRHVLKRPQQHTDWVSAAFWVVPSHVWRRLRGLDEGFYMYCEDTDFCLRLQLAGWKLARAQASAEHAAARASRHLGPAMAWHLRSLVRLWLRPPLWQFLFVAAKARQ
jgi:N-acetylglucosaminyl-diphospho-decaprenol L-rhamnosyltransferase